MSRIEISGQRFGRWLVLDYSHSVTGDPYYNCICDCGTKGVILSRTLRTGSSQSCGCLNREKILKTITTHGRSKSREYRTWSQMLQRCNNPNNDRYNDYGGRGIKVCERWHEFENFFKDIGERPKGKSLDRIDNDQGYCKENCRWATPSEQQLNKRKILIMFDGKSMTANEWGKHIGIDEWTIQRRIKKGLSLDKVLYAGDFKKLKKNEREGVYQYSTL